MILEFWTHTGRQGGMMGSCGHRKVCGECLAPTLRQDDCGYSRDHMENMVCLKKVRHYEKSRLVDENHRLLNSTQMSF